MDVSKLPQEVKDMLAKRLKENPELVEKFGNPLDPNDPSYWSPSEREEKGLSLEDRVHYLERDVEMMNITVGKTVQWMLAEQDRQMRQRIEEAKRDPQKAMELLREMMGEIEAETPGDFGPGNGEVAYAGSVEGIAPDQLVETVNGRIRADQIPGYRNDPNWKPSRDWIDANCTCPSHVAMRESNGNSPFGDLPPGPTGMYL